MKAYSFIIMLTLVGIHLRSQVMFLPEKPQNGQTLTISYNPANGPLAKSNFIQANAYFINETPSKSFEILLKKEGDLWTGSVSMANANGLLIVFRDTTTKAIDNNKRKGYSVLIHNADGTVAKNARIGLIKTTTAASMNKTFLLQYQPYSNLKYYEDEFVQYPEQKHIYFEEYATTLLAIKKEKSHDFLNKEVPIYLSKKDTMSIETLYFAQSMYKQLGKPEKTESYAKQIRAKDPKGSLVQSERCQKLLDETNANKQIAMFNDFFRDFPNSNIGYKVVDAIRNIYVSIPDTTALRQFMPKADNYYTNTIGRAVFYSTTAQMLAQTNKGLVLAEELGRKALTFRYDTKNTGFFEAYLKSKLAFVLEKANKNLEAYNYYKEAVVVDLGPEEGGQINEEFILVALKVGKYDEVIAKGEQLMKNTMATNKVKEAVRVALSKKMPPTEAKAYMVSLNQQVNSHSKNELKKQQMNEPAPDFTLKDLEGNTIKLSNYRGKIVVLDFWGTWCGACVASFPGMQLAQNKYKNNPNVKFLFVDISEKGPKEQRFAKVREFINKHKFNDFTVPMDIDGKASAAYKLQVVPAKFVIDTKGNIRYKAVGSSYTADIVAEEIGLMIESIMED